MIISTFKEILTVYSPTQSFQFLELGEKKEGLEVPLLRIYVI